MTPESFAERVLRLEGQMTSLQDLPKKVDDLALQISQLRVDLRGEIAAMRRDVSAEIAETRRHMRVLHEDVIARIAQLQEGLPPRGKPRRRRE